MNPLISIVKLKNKKQHRYWERRYRQGIKTKKQNESCSNWGFHAKLHIRKRTQ